jgi:hypothetical protein
MTLKHTSAVLFCLLALVLLVPLPASAQQSPATAPNSMGTPAVPSTAGSCGTEASLDALFGGMSSVQYTAGGGVANPASCSTTYSSCLNNCAPGDPTCGCLCHNRYCVCSHTCQLQQC